MYNYINNSSVKLFFISLTIFSILTIINFNWNIDYSDVKGIEIDKVDDELSYTLNGEELDVVDRVSKLTQENLGYNSNIFYGKDGVIVKDSNFGVVFFYVYDKSFFESKTTLEMFIKENNVKGIISSYVYTFNIITVLIIYMFYTFVLFIVNIIFHKKPEDSIMEHISNSEDIQKDFIVFYNKATYNGHLMFIPFILLTFINDMRIMYLFVFIALYMGAISIVNYKNIRKQLED